MKTETQFNRHISAVCRCGQRFIITKKILQSDLFGNEKTTQLNPLQLFCKSYFCPSCRKVKINQYRKRIKQNLGSETWRFLTLTTINNHENTRLNLHQINDDWNRLRTLLNKRFGKIKYVKALEVSPSGMVHLHVLVNTFLPAFFIRRFWIKYCGAYRIEITRVKDHSTCLNYLTKYISKTSADEEINKLFYVDSRRRFTFSNEFSKPISHSDKYSLVCPSIFKPSQLLDYMLDLATAFNLSYDDFCFTNLPPPFAETLRQKFKEYFSLI